MIFIIKNAHIINASSGYHADILISGGRISLIRKDISAGDYQGATVIDASGKYVFPGGIDPHVHMHLPTAAGYSGDDFRSGSRAALMGGTTTIIDFVTPTRGQSLVDALKLRKQEAANCLIDFGLHVSPVEWRTTTADEIRECIRQGYRSFKIYMAYKNSIGVDDEVIEKVMQVVSDAGGLVIMHCETGDEIEERRNRLFTSGHREPLSHPRSRPPHTESNAVKTAITLAEKTGCPLYVVHVSTAETVDLIRKAQLSGIHVMGEACPHHLLLDESLYEKPFDQSAPYVLSPPLRCRHNREALWQGLIDGTLQTVATDHCPFYLKQKALGKNDFRKIANGAGSIEHRLALLYTYGVLQNRISLNQFVALTSTNAAKIFGLFPRKGHIAEGAIADILIWNPNKKQTISAASHHQNCDHNIYEGFENTGHPEKVIVKGKLW